MIASGLHTTRVYPLARGRYAPQQRVVDRLYPSASVVTGRPSTTTFLEQIEREMRIRFYQPNTVRDYQAALNGLLRWFGREPHQVTREDVREYLLYLVDADASASWVGKNLSAIRTAFDKMCQREVTLGLATPRRPKTLPLVLSKNEIKRLLEAAPTLGDKLLFGLMYATGIRVSEVARLRFRDIDFDRGVIAVWQGKGRKDRYVILPQTFRSLLREMAGKSSRDGFVFPGARTGRHISTRTIQRRMKRAIEIAGIRKRATPHSLRHSFATHSFENGCDIRSIQKLLGHTKLETTTIYVKVAQPKPSDAIQSPLDLLQGENNTRPVVQVKQTPSVGSLRLHFKPCDQQGNGRFECQVTIGIATNGPTVYLTGIVAREARPGWITLEIPPLEKWEEPMRWLSREQKERLEDPRFFELLQKEIPRRVQALRNLN